MKYLDTAGFNKFTLGQVSFFKVTTFSNYQLQMNRAFDKSINIPFITIGIH
jgi:hypothetical protein